jgi:hypothetical protein
MTSIATKAITSPYSRVPKAESSRKMRTIHYTVSRSGRPPEAPEL